MFFLSGIEVKFLFSHEVSYKIKIYCDPLRGVSILMRKGMDHTAVSAGDPLALATWSQRELL